MSCVHFSCCAGAVALVPKRERGSRGFFFKTTVELEATASHASLAGHVAGVATGADLISGPLFCPDTAGAEACCVCAPLSETGGDPFHAHPHYRCSQRGE